MKVYIETLGCPKNIWDSRQGTYFLRKSGHEITDKLSEARVVIVNTCGFIDDAKEESIDTILDLAEYKNEGAILMVSGCLSERYRKELFDEMPEISILTGVNDYSRLAELIEKYKAEGRFYSFSDGDIEASEVDLVASLGRAGELGGSSAYLKIAEGCDSFCSYCVIPFIRGRYKSRPMENIVNEASALAKQGIKEVILIAQDLTYYGLDVYGSRKLPNLLTELVKIADLKWIRLMYCYEDGITDELIEVMAENEKICPYIDIPIQHSEDSVLQAMNRNSTKTSIKDTVGRLRAAIPHIHIRTTLLSGFPGESEEDAKALEEFIGEMKFERLGVFAFSREEGTPAYDMANQIPEDVIEDRRNSLMELQRAISLKLNEAKIGSELEVLVEEKENDLFLGRSVYDAPEIDNMVIFSSDFDEGPEIGSFVKVEIDDAWDYDLFGKEVRK